ncbi:MAG TPA: GNAT family N-acetyltransferase [Gaiellaceae bacterium]|nr:GNAT family N-acetyltransferase [Gaiellaceae bacterium]
MRTRVLELPHGPVVFVRPLRNGDVVTVAAVVAGLDPDLCRRLARVDARHHALVGHVAGDSRPAGFAQLVRTGEHSAEVAVAVASGHHCGIGPALTRLLLEDARAAGITEVTALGCGDNRAALAPRQSIRAAIA